MSNNITDEEITRLARGVAIEMSCDGKPTEDDVWQYEDVIRILLRSHCLVEKSRVKEGYHKANIALGKIDPCSETWIAYLAQKSLLERLFGDTLKEEGV